MYLARDEQEMLEGKYRQATPGSLDSEFDQFISTIYSAIRKERGSDAIEADEFCFISNISPTKWRRFLRGRQQCCKKVLIPKS